MAFSVVMPALEMAQETGKLIAWRKKEGESVTKGEPLLEIETDKAVMEVEAPADGILAGITGEVGTDIQVGKTIAWIVAPGENPPTENPSISAPTARAGSSTKIETPAAPASAATARSPTSSPRISPKARRLAKELRVEIATVHGSGPAGAVLASDVQAAAAVTAASSAPVEKKPGSLEVPSTLGRLMAERTTQSWTTVPHFFVTREIDAGELNAYRGKIIKESERTQNIRVTRTDLLVALAARVLLKHPRLNASYTPQGIRLHDHVNMGVAIAVNDGVVAAVIPSAHIATLVEIANQRHAIAERARAGNLRPPDIADATFTISNLGMFHVDHFTAIVIPPQAAILAVGAIADRVIAVEGKPAVRTMMTLTLSCDHRAADGARAAMFLDDLAKALHEPEKWLA